jgi:hypothetical protein
MINPQHLPTMHKEFSALRKSYSKKQLEKNSDLLNLLNRFMYRYRMSKAFKTIVAVDVEKRTVDGYACGMKLFMAYSAYDELREAEMYLKNSKKMNTHKLKNKDLAERIRKNIKMKQLLLDTKKIKDEGLRAELKKFYEGRNDEVMCFATCLRHCFVHGDFTTARSGLTTKTQIAVVDEVTEMVLKVSDELFTKIVTV